MIKGIEILKIFEKQIDSSHFWQIFKKKKIEHRIERLQFLGLHEYYNENQDGTYSKVEMFDPDKLVMNNKKMKEIMDGNRCVSKCLNCRYGAIFEVDPIEKIGQCHMCFTEFKLS